MYTVYKSHHVCRGEDELEISMAVITLASAAHDLLDISKFDLIALARLGKILSIPYHLLKMNYLDVSNMVTLVVVDK